MLGWKKNEETSPQVQTALASLTEKPAKSGKSKNISNQHPKLKVSCPYLSHYAQPNLAMQGIIIHPMFFNLCGVNHSIGSSEHIEVLASHTPHPGGVPFVMDGDKPIWHLAWSEKINQSVNAKFINEVIGRVWDAETVSGHPP